MCEIYYVWKDGRQEYSNLPIEEIEQMTVGGYVCRSCRPKYFSKDVVVCSTYREYLRKLPLCAGCKKNHGKSIKNAFFRNFVLYRTRTRVFSIKHIVLYTLWLYLSGGSTMSGLILANLVDYQRGGFSLLRNILKSVLMALSHLWMPGGTVCYMYCLFHVVLSKKWVYRVPINLDQSTPNLLEYLEQLNIGESRRKRHP